MTLGQKIRQLRENAYMTQSQLAKELNISNGTMSKYESDQLEANVSIIKAISSIFHVTADYLIDEETTLPVCPPRLTEDEIDLINLARDGDLNYCILDERERQLIQMYRQLLPEDKGEVRGLIRGLAIKREDSSKNIAT